MTKHKQLTTADGAAVPDNQDAMTAGTRGPMLLQDVWYPQRLAHLDRQVIPEQRMRARSSGAYGEFTLTHDITRYTEARVCSKIGKETEVLVRFSSVAGERSAADAERDIRSFATKFHTEEGNWDLVGNNTPVFFLRDPHKLPDLNRAVKRAPQTNLRWATDERMTRLLRRLVYHQGYNRAAAGAFHQRLHNLSFGEVQRIALPMTDLDPIRDGSWPGINEQTPGNRLGVPPPTQVPGAPFLPAPQILKQLLLAAERERVDEAADALRAHNGPALLGPQAPGCLLRRKTSLQPVDLQLAQSPVSPARTPGAATPTGPATLLRLGQALPTPGVDLKPFLSREVNISCHTSPGPRGAGLGVRTQKPCRASASALEWHPAARHFATRIDPTWRRSP